jgi:hypothetical protein
MANSVLALATSSGRGDPGFWAITLSTDQLYSAPT